MNKAWQLLTQFWDVAADVWGGRRLIILSGITMGLFLMMLVVNILLWVVTFTIPEVRFSVNRNLLEAAEQRRLEVEAEKTIRVPEQYPSISEAIYNAQPGQVIRVGKGIYEEQLFLKNGVSIVGAGPDLTYVMSRSARHPALRAAFVEEAYVQGVTFMIQDPKVLPEEERAGVASFSNSGVVLRDSRFHGSWGYGVLLRSGSTVLMKNCKVSNNQMGGIMARGLGTDPYLVDSDIMKNGGPGVFFQDHAGGMVERCIISENQGFGLKVQGGGTIFHGRDLTLSGNILGGVYLEEGLIFLEESLVTENQGTGIRLESSRPGTIFRRVKIVRNEEEGVYAKSGALLLSQVTLQQNGKIGLVLDDTSGRVLLNQLKYKENEGGPWQWLNGASPVVKGEQP